MRIIFILLIFLSTILYAGIAQKEDDFKELDNIPTSELLKFIATNLSKSLPQQIDYKSRATRIYALPTELNYVKELDTTEKVFDGATFEHNGVIHKLYFEADVKLICNEPIFKYLFISRNISARLTYKDFNKKFLFEHTVNKKDCENYNILLEE